MLGRGSDSFRPDSWPGCAARGCPSLPPVLPARVVRQGGAVETRSTSRRDGSAVRQQGQVRRVRRELEGRARVPQFLSRVLRVDRPEISINSPGASSRPRSAWASLMVGADFATHQKLRRGPAMPDERLVYGCVGADRPEAQPFIDEVDGILVYICPKQCIYLHQFESLEEARRIIGEFIARYNAEWLIERLGHRTPAQARAEALARAA